MGKIKNANDFNLKINFHKIFHIPSTYFPHCSHFEMILLKIFSIFLNSIWLLDVKYYIFEMESILLCVKKCCVCTWIWLMVWWECIWFTQVFPFSVLPSATPALSPWFDSFSRNEKLLKLICRFYWIRL